MLNRKMATRREQGGTYDIIIVGSGAAGGMAAHELCSAGLNVLMLEIGRDYDPTTESPMFQTPQQAPLRAAATPDKPMGFYDATVDGAWEIAGEPYTVADNSEEFHWWRPRMLGGRTNHWGRVALRFGPYDFAPQSRDGLGFDWPISYDNLAPWYDRVERLIGVTGLAQGLENTPDSPPDVLLKRIRSSMVSANAGTCVTCSCSMEPPSFPVRTRTPCRC